MPVLSQNLHPKPPGKCKISLKIIKNKYSFLASARVTLEVIQDSPEIRMIRLSFILK